MSDLVDALLSLETVSDAENLIKDLLTPKEARILQERLKVAKILYKTDKSYRQIAEETGASLTTIGRVARFLKEESFGGYNQVLQKIAK